MLNRTINDLYIGRPNPKKGDVGLEIEVEGRRLPRQLENWNTVHEGSIGGRDMAFEYVLKGPMTLSKTSESLKELNRAYAEKESVLADAYRAGTHVHINCQKLTLLQAFNFVALSLCLEPIILRDCGQERVGNLFCLQAVDAEGYIASLSRAFTDEEGFRRLDQNNVKYSAVNAAPMATFGSLEFRCMRSTADPKILMPFIRKLLKIRKYACELRNPVEIMNKFSIMGASDFISEVLEEPIELSPEEEAAMWDSIRVVQDLAYCREW